MLFFRRQPQNSILGLALDGRDVQAAVLRRPNGDFQLQRIARAELTLDPLTSDPALVGRELRKHLDSAGIREKSCAVSLPLNWALTLQTKIPEIPEADVPDYLSIQAERGFPYSLDELVIATSRYRSPSGTEQATLIAIPKGHLDRLEQVLRAAQLRPASFSLNVAALSDPAVQDPSGVVALLVRNHHAELHVLSSGGILVLRTLEGVFEPDGDHGVNTDSVAREIRITLGQLPKEFRDGVKRVQIIGATEEIRPVTEDLTAHCASLGLKIEAAAVKSPSTGDRFQFNGSPLPPAVGVACRRLHNRAHPLEFLTPKPSAWSRRLAGFSSQQFVWIGVAAAALALLTITAFAWQYWTLAKLESKWRAVEPRVSDLEAQQQRIRQFRSWYDESVQGLRILRKLTEVFPSDGSVTAKSVDFKQPSLVTCSGIAADNPALQKVLEQLRQSPQVANLKLEQFRGNRPPLQFTFQFDWIEGGPQ